METKDKDFLYQWFADMPDEALPADFNEKAMRKIMAEAASLEKKRKRREFFGTASGAVAMLVAGVLAFSYFDLSIELPKFFDATIELPKFNLPAWSFPNPDYGLFTSPSFHLSLIIGIATLFLLIVDSTIRRNIEKSRNSRRETGF